MSFCNSTIVPVDVAKPHIVFINGFWRVSQLHRRYIVDLNVMKRFTAAHSFVQRLNDGLNYPWGYRNET